MKIVITYVGWILVEIHCKSKICSPRPQTEIFRIKINPFLIQFSFFPGETVLSFMFPDKHWFLVEIRILGYVKWLEHHEKTMPRCEE
jgi:hypothetical protein